MSPIISVLRTFSSDQIGSFAPWRLDRHACLRAAFLLLRYEFEKFHFHFMLLIIPPLMAVIVCLSHKSCSFLC